MLSQHPPPPPKPPDPPFKVKKVSFQDQQPTEQKVDCAGIINRVLESAATKTKERKEPELSAKAVDCRVLLEGQADRSCGLWHAQELLGKYCCIQTSLNCFVGVVSRECIVA
jgi:hypothetical protein